MMFEPFLQAVAMGREENHVRTAATSTEPPEKHMRLTEPQMEELLIVPRSRLQLIK